MKTTEDKRKNPKLGEKTTTAMVGFVSYAVIILEVIEI